MAETPNTVGVKPGLQPKHIRIDRSVLDGDDAFVPIEPVWWTVNISDGEREYERSLAEFSRPQRLVFAVHWYRTEVNNGGHHQFYWNSTGIVWRDVLAGFEEMGLSDYASVVRESASLLGGDPPLDRAKREAILEGLGPEIEDKFDALDTRYYALEVSQSLDEALLVYMRKHSRDFEFDGTVMAGF